MSLKDFTQRFKPCLIRFSRLMAVGFCFLIFVSGSPDNSQISRAEFVAMIAENQPDHPFLPKNHTELSQEELFNKMSRILKIRGFKVLSGKDAKGLMTDQEFVRVAYALSGEPPGKSLFDQKLFLKEQGVVKSADVGIATGAEGKILQFHEGETSSSDVELASPVFMNDRIKTKSDSEASFTFDDKSTLTLGENSNISIKKHIYDPDKDLRQTVVNVALGTVRFVVTKGKAKGSSFKVVTPTAVAGVRGTEFVVTVDKGGKTSFIGISGSIETAPLLANGQLGKKSIVAKGQIQEISKGALEAKVKANNGNAFGKDKGNKGKSEEKGNKGNASKGKGKANKLADKGINKSKAEKTAKSRFLKKESVQKPRIIKVAGLSAGPGSTLSRSLLKGGNSPDTGKGGKLNGSANFKNPAKPSIITKQLARPPVLRPKRPFIPTKNGPTIIAGNSGGGNPGNPGGGNPGNPGGGNPGNPGGGNPGNPGGGNPGNPGGGKKN